mmetsp:Transcript_36479/g.79856  ORF Transcript_36479/g.79856 Transcript_36479/m.79856 type:complete len:124 (-) Transcript_36479:232-603(-)
MMQQRAPLRPSRYSLQDLACDAHLFRPPEAMPMEADDLDAQLQERTGPTPLETLGAALLMALGCLPKSDNGRAALRAVGHYAQPPLGLEDKVPRTRSTSGGLGAWTWPAVPSSALPTYERFSP